MTLVEEEESVAVVVVDRRHQKSQTKRQRTCRTRIEVTKESYYCFLRLLGRRVGLLHLLRT